MEGLDVDDVFQHCRLNPTEVDAVTYYLPRLPARRCGREVHPRRNLRCEPKDLARHAVCAAVSNGDRFFFTTQEQEGANSRRRRGGTGPSEDHGDQPRRQGRRGQEPVVQKEGQVHRVMEEYRARSRPPLPRG
ncbi:hypothetical protein ZWY2020_049309 [Hordeum vulgare]|nr:hypothetical protein ZWY2020_049309 [Hordeum vulgare]